MNAFFQLIEWLFGNTSAFQRPKKTPPPWSPVEIPEPDPVFPPSNPSPDLPAAPSTDDLRIGLAIVDREARRDAAGNVVIYRLPGNDGGGTHEVAGINSVYHPEMLKKLTGMAPPDREAACAEYIENYTLRMTGLSKSDRLRIGTLYQVLDTTFHRGAGGSAWVVQTSLRTLGYSVIRDRKWGPNTRTALMKADRDFPDSLNKLIRKNREVYERTVVGYRANFWKGFVNRWDGVFALAETWNAETPAPVRVPVTDPMTAPPVETVEPAPVLESLPDREFGLATQIASAMQRKGYRIFEDNSKDYNLNIVGVRNEDGELDEFTCRIVVFWKRPSGEWETRGWKATTYPGSRYLIDRLLNRAGAAILVPGQYPVYRLDTHNGKYKALCQRRGVVKVYRDGNRDRKFDRDPKSIMEGMFGINIHAPVTPTASTRGYVAANVRAASAGCQVFQRVDDFTEFRGICEKAADLWGNSFTYTLIEEADLL